VPIQYDSIYRRFIEPNVADWALGDLRLTPALVTLIEQAGTGYDRIGQAFTLDVNEAESNLRPERLPEAISRAAFKAREAGKPLDGLISEAEHKLDSFRAKAPRLVPIRDANGVITGYTEARPAHEPSAVQAMRYGLIIEHVALQMAPDERDRRYVDEKAKGGDSEFCDALEFAPSCVSLIGAEARRIADHQQLKAVGLDEKLRAEEFGVSTLVRLKDAFHAFIDQHAGTRRRSADDRTGDAGRPARIVHDGGLPEASP
jgi:hypothetical protein